MAYVGYSLKRTTSDTSSKPWSVDGIAGRIALTASLLFVAIAIFGL